MFSPIIFIILNLCLVRFEGFWIKFCSFSTIVKQNWSKNGWQILKPTWRRPWTCHKSYAWINLVTKVIFRPLVMSPALKIHENSAKLLTLISKITSSFKVSQNKCLNSKIPFHSIYRIWIKLSKLDLVLLEKNWCTSISALIIDFLKFHCSMHELFSSCFANIGMMKSLTKKINILNNWFIVFWIFHM